MRLGPVEKRVYDIAAPVAQDLGLNIVHVKIIGEGGSQNVQIMAEEPETRKLGIDKCAELSRALSAVMDVEDPIKGAYRLEVSSPGIDRPLVKIEDFKTYTGFEVKLETEKPTETGQKRFRGHIKSVEGDLIKIEMDQGLAEIPFEQLVKAKLVLSDDLIKATANL